MTSLALCHLFVFDKSLPLNLEPASAPVAGSKGRLLPTPRRPFDLGVKMLMFRLWYNV